MGFLPRKYSAALVIVLLLICGVAILPTAHESQNFHKRRLAQLLDEMPRISFSKKRVIAVLGPGETALNIVPDQLEGKVENTEVYNFAVGNSGVKEIYRVASALEELTKARGKKIDVALVQWAPASFTKDFEINSRGGIWSSIKAKAYPLFHHDVFLGFLTKVARLNSANPWSRENHGAIQMFGDGLDDLSRYYLQNADEIYASGMEWRRIFSGELTMKFDPAAFEQFRQAVVKLHEAAERVVIIYLPVIFRPGTPYRSIEADNRIDYVLQRIREGRKVELWDYSEKWKPEWRDCLDGAILSAIGKKRLNLLIADDIAKELVR